MASQSQHKDDDETVLVASRETLESFQEDVQYLWGCSDIKVYEEPPSALDFLRNHVAVSRPCIIRNSIVTRRSSENSEDACVRDAVPLKVTLDDLVRRFPDTDNEEHGNDSDSPAATAEKGPLSLPPLCVDVTPDGHGDCLRKVLVAVDDEANTDEEKVKVFVKPLERDMTISDFRRHLRRGRIKQQHDQELQLGEGERDNILDRVFLSSPDPSGLDSKCDSSDKANDCDVDDMDFLEDCVLYYSRQNDCLREELSSLWNAKSSSNHNDDSDSYLFPRSFPWAEEAFFGEQRGPDAVNLWMGDERAVSAMHKDHYENLFYVLSGEKVFGLCPPSDAPFLYEREVIGGRFDVSSVHQDDSSKDDDDDDEKRGPRRRWTVDLDREEEKDANLSSDNSKKYSKVHWIATDLFGTDSNPVVEKNEKEQFPLSRYAHPVTVRVQAGELLYLPSLWFHRVTQTCETVGINYWYDMNFESPMWCYFHFLQQLRSQQRQRPPLSTNGDD